MSTSNEVAVMRLALEALKNHSGNYKLTETEAANQIAAEVALEEALAQSRSDVKQEQRSDNEQLGEPVSFDAWYEKFHSFAGKSFLLYSDLHCAWQAAKLYTTPQPVTESHKRKPLTDEQIMELWPFIVRRHETQAFIKFAKSIEAAHGIKE